MRIGLMVGFILSFFSFCIASDEDKAFNPYLIAENLKKYYAIRNQQLAILSKKKQKQVPPTKPNPDPTTK